MLRRKLTALLAAAATFLPAAARADDWEYTDEWTDERPSDGYDVRVDDVGPSGSVTFDSFHAELSPYGQWVTVGAYGRVWRPHVAAGWRPYYYGRWEWTNEGWLWVSDEPFGWAAYHYGRWTYDSFYGWVWVPGYQWAPAWVHWRYSGDVIGWAPLAPGLSIYVSTYPFYDTWWTFVPTVRFVSGPVYRYAYAPSYTRQYFHRTAPAPARPAPRGGVRAGVAPAPAWGGPAPRVVEERVGRPIRPARIVAAPAPGAARARPGEVTVYRPEVRAARSAERGRSSGASAPAPGRSREAFAPSSRGEAPGRREGGYAPAPRSEERGRREGGFVPAPRGEDRGGRREGAAPAPRGEERGREGGFAPAPRGRDRGDREERREAAPSPRAERSESRAAPRAAPRAEPRSAGGGGGFRPSAPSGGGRSGAVPSRGDDRRR